MNLRTSRISSFSFQPLEKGPAQRLKLRTENGYRQILFFYDRSKEDVSGNSFLTWEIDDPRVQEILSTILGIRVTVRKRREEWQKGNIVFHLDKVDNIGKIFEVEILEQVDPDAVGHVAMICRQLDPYLGSRIIGSNEDLIARPL